MKRVSDEFKRKVVEYDLDSSADSHLDAWKERYYRKNKKDIEFDLRVNHMIMIRKLINLNIG